MNTECSHCTVSCLIDKIHQLHIFLGLSSTRLVNCSTEKEKIKARVRNAIQQNGRSAYHAKNVSLMDIPSLIYLQYTE